MAGDRNLLFTLSCDAVMTIDDVTTTASTTGAVISKRDRFRGALLGLQLAPTALSLLESRLSNQPFRQTVKATEMETLTSMVKTGFAWLQIFSSEANAFHLPLSSMIESSAFKASLRQSQFNQCPLWLISLPVLLRYHTTAELRSRWLTGQQSSLHALAKQRLTKADQNSPVAEQNEVEQLSKALQRIEQLGNFVEMALSGSTPPLLDYVTESAVCSSYLLAIRTAAADVRADAMRKVHSTIEVIETGSIQIGKTSQHPLEKALLTGLLWGASKGVGTLPALLQLEQNQLEQGQLEDSSPFGTATRQFSSHLSQRTSVLALADRFYEQWAGIQSIKSDVL